MMAFSLATRRRCPMTRRAVVLVVLASVLGLGIAMPVAAEQTEPVYGYALAHELMSPFCPGRTLAACTSEQAAEMRQWILLQEASGATREEVIAVLQSRYGDVILSAPAAEGWGLAAWLLPGAAVLIGALLAAIVLRKLVAAPKRNRGPSAEAVAAPTGPASAGGDDAALERLIDAELAATRR